VLDWFRRLRKVSRKLSLPSRDAAGGRGQTQLNISKLTPPIENFVAQLAYLSQSTSRLLRQSADTAPTAELAAGQLEVSERYLERSKKLTALLAKQGLDAVEAIDPFVQRIETFHARSTGQDWYEKLISFYLALGILEDLYERLAAGLPAQKRTQVLQLLSDETGFDFAREQLLTAIKRDPKIAARLALWGRSIIADVLLEVRATVDFSNSGIVESNPVERARAEFRYLEPLTGELIGTHTMRMDTLGLTA
jgi:hypothetical protein